MPSTSAERSRNARRAALHRSANSDPAEMTAPMRGAFLARFMPPEELGLEPAERERRAAAGLREYMTGLSAKAAKARQRATQAAADAADVEAELDDLAASADASL
jgi:hypothetical protein